MQHRAAIRFFSRLTSSAAKNHAIALTAAILFASNQLVEFLVMNLFNFEYSGLCNWDCEWYSSIVSSGYDIKPHGHSKGDAANWAFFPAFPYIARSMHLLTGLSPAISLILTGKLIFFLAVFAFIKFGLTYYPKMNPLVLGGVVVFNPYALYGNTGYTEPLFLLSSSCFFYFLKRKRYVLAGMCGAMLSSVRVVGIVSVFSYIVDGVKDFFRGGVDQRLSIVLGLLIIPLGLGFFMIFLYYFVGDALAFAHIQRAWGRELHNPLTILMLGMNGSELEKYFAAMAVFGFFCSGFFFINKNSGLALFSVLCTLIPLSTSLVALPRYVWWQAPVLIFVAVLASSPRVSVILFPALLSGLIFMYVSWFTARGFVI